MENSEQQLAIIPTKKYAIYVTNKRLAFIKISGHSTGTIIGGAFGGAIGGVIGEAVEAAVRKRREAKKQGDEDSIGSEIDEMLRKDKKNYALTHDELESVVFNKSQWSKLDPVKLVICSKIGQQEANVELTPKEAEQIFKVFSSISTLSGRVREQYS
jgi:hypothetical protein